MQVDNDDKDLNPADKGQEQNTDSAAEIAALKESIAKLEANSADLLNEKKQEKEKREKAEAEAEAAKNEKAKADGDYKQLYESSQTELEAQKTRNSEFAQQTEKADIRKEAAKLANELTKHSGRAEDLTEKIAARLKRIDGELKVLDTSGQLTVSSLLDLKADISTKFDWLIDGSQASGGGAPGNTGFSQAPAKNEKAEAAKKRGDGVAFLNAALETHFKKA